MILLVTGARDYQNPGHVYAVLDAMHARDPITLIVTGACPCGGVDKMAEDWARYREIDYRGCPAKFQTGTLGRGEGPARNARMQHVAPLTHCVFFPGGTGTASCIAHFTRAYPHAPLIDALTVASPW